MENKTVVIYKSKYGSSKKYAAWIALKLDADLYEIKDITPSQLDQYNTVIYGAGVYAGRINGIKFINKNINRLQSKNTIVFAVGIESDLYNVKEMLELNINKDFVKKIDVFRFLGEFDYNNLGVIDKIAMKALKMKIEKKEKLSSDEKLILEGFNRKIDLCDKKSIDRLLETVLKYN